MKTMCHSEPVGLEPLLTRDEWLACAAAARKSGQPKAAEKIDAALAATEADEFRIEIADAGVEWLAKLMQGTDAGRKLQQLLTCVTSPLWRWPNCRIHKG